MKSFKDFSAVLKAPFPFESSLLFLGILQPHRTAIHLQQSVDGKDMMTNLESSSAESTLASRRRFSNVQVWHLGQCDSRSAIRTTVWSATIQRAIISIWWQRSCHWGNGWTATTQMCNEEEMQTWVSDLILASPDVESGTLQLMVPGGGGCGSGPCSASNNIISA
jgi:hypothetical protein